MFTGNPIGRNPFGNYYWVQAAQGETLVLGASLQLPFTDIDRVRCVESPASYHNKQLRVFDARLTQAAFVCADNMRFVVPAAGFYVIQADYGANAGVLNAARL
jgi:hypothetical protein